MPQAESFFNSHTCVQFMASITFFEVKADEKKHLKKNLKGHNIEFIEDPINEKNLSLAKKSDIISVFIYSKLDKKVLEKLPKLKFIATRSTGFDHINLKQCKKQNIQVSNVPSYGENTVAEHTIALILSLSRNIHKSYVRTLNEDFSNQGLVGFDLKDKTIGIIGGGRIGLHVARIARAFGMHVRVYDINHDPFLAELINFKYESFEKLLKTSDIISLHVPHNKFTHHLINKNNINSLKKGAILINTARGEVIDIDAIYDALVSKRLGGLGIDVIEGEELIKEEHQILHKSENPEKWKKILQTHEIFKMENVVFTPHNAFNSKEALLRILDTTIENINCHNEKAPQNKLV